MGDKRCDDASAAKKQLYIMKTLKAVSSHHEEHWIDVVSYSVLLFIELYD